MLYEDKEFKIIKTKRDYILIRKNHPRSYHSHFKQLNGARLVAKLFKQRLVPYKEYFIEAMRRVTSDSEFESFGQQKLKPKYKNRR